MKTTTILTSLAMFATLTFMGCGPDEGLGGSSEIHFVAKHHTQAIPYTTVFIKYGSQSSPGVNSGDYDMALTSDSLGQGHFDNLQKGDYYLYGIGYDSSLAGVVNGGVPVKIKKDGDRMDVTIAVTED